MAANNLIAVAFWLARGQYALALYWALAASLTLTVTFGLSK